MENATATQSRSKVGTIKALWKLAVIAFTSNRYTIFALSEGNEDTDIVFSYRGLKDKIPLEYLKGAVKQLEDAANRIKLSQEIEQMTGAK